MSLPCASHDAPSHNDQHLSDTDADDHEEEVIQEDHSAGAEKSRQVYIGSGNDKKALYLLCIGLNCPDRNEEPFFRLRQSHGPFFQNRSCCALET